MVDLEAKRAAAKAALEAAKAAITEDDKAEIAVRDEIASIDAERETVEQTKRSVDIARRLDTAKDALGPDAMVDSVEPDTFQDTFIVFRNGKAYSDFKSKIQAIGHGKKINQSDAERSYVVACIYDWNGHTDMSELLTDPSMANAKGVSNTVGAELHKFLTKNEGIVTLLSESIAKLAGVFARDRKS